MKTLIKILSIWFAATASLNAPAASAGDYVMVFKRGVRVRVAPTTTADIVGITENGDIFEVFRSSAEWYGIIMFSGDIRYIHASLARPVDKLPSLPSTEIRKEACIEIAKAQDRASTEAQDRFATHFDRMIDHERLLTDRYELPIFHYFGIAPAHNASLLTECVTKRWN